MPLKDNKLTAGFTGVCLFATIGMGLIEVGQEHPGMSSGFTNDDGGILFACLLIGGGSANAISCGRRFCVVAIGNLTSKQICRWVVQLIILMIFKGHKENDYWRTIELNYPKLT